MKVTQMRGQMVFKKLTHQVKEKEFAQRKARIWLDMLNSNMKPVKWLKSTKNGTKVNIEMIRTEEEYEQGLTELNLYLQEMNELYRLNYQIHREESSSES